MLDLSFFEPLRAVVILAAPAMPAAVWGVTILVGMLLMLAAGIDAATYIVPDPVILVGLVLVTVTQGFFDSWGAAGFHLRQAILVGIVIWGINALWYRLFRHDALGMGDAKWTMLAVACFGVAPALYAWSLGSIFALIFLGFTKAFRRPLPHVAFAPFLLLGLCAGIYWVRLR